MRKFSIFKKTQIILVFLIFCLFFIPFQNISANTSSSILIYVFRGGPSSYNNFTKLENFLKEKGYHADFQKRIAENELNPSLLSKYSQIWIIDNADPKSLYAGKNIYITSKEIENLVDYYNSGNSILLTGENGETEAFYNINLIAQEFGVTMGHGKTDASGGCSILKSTSSTHSFSILNGVSAISTSGLHSNVFISSINPYVESVATEINDTNFIYVLDGTNDDFPKGRVIFHPSYFTFLDGHPFDLDINACDNKQYIENISKWLNDIPLHPSCTLTPSSTSITSGESVTITWSSENADSVVDSINLDNTAELSGSITKILTRKTNYQLRVANSSGETADCEAIVNVNQPSAQLPIEVSAPSPTTSQNTTVNLPNKSLSEILQDLIKWLLQIVILIAILMIIVSGAMYMISAGDQQKAETAKKALTYAILGLLVAGLAYAIVKTLVDVLSK